MPEVLREERYIHDWQRGTTWHGRVLSQRRCTRCGLWETKMSRLRPCEADDA